MLKTLTTMLILAQTEATKLEIKNLVQALEGGEEDVEGYKTITQWSEVCGKGCSTPGMHCEQQPSTLADCSALCSANPECKGFQKPADNGFHNWCVWFDYKLKKVRSRDNSHYCHDNNTLYKKKGPLTDFKKLPNWSEVSGKGCSSHGMHCEQQPSTKKECAEKCDANTAC